MIDTSKETLTLSNDKIFPTIEGEGRLIGTPSVFMRMATCNLTCNAWKSDDNPHGCDSYISWSVKNKMTFDEVFELMESQNIHTKLINGGWILKVTGGEPMIRQKEIMRFIDAFIIRYGAFPAIDFETNGTIMPDPKWVETYNATFTVSPKLSTNGDPEEKTYKPEVLKYLKEQLLTCFKFVITGPDDIQEIWRKYVEDDNGINLRPGQVWFMPCCGSRQEHIDRAAAVVEYAKAMSVNFSPRLQLLVWDKALGV